MPRSSTFAGVVAAFLSLVLASPSQGAGGSLDRNFGQGTGYVQYRGSVAAKWRISAVSAQADGRAIIAGFADNTLLVRRYALDGTMDTGFGANGTLEFPLPQPPGYIQTPRIVEGADGVYVAAGGTVRRLDAQGRIDQGFWPQDIVVGYHPDGGAVFRLLVPSDRRMVVVTSQFAEVPTDNISVRYYLPSGLPDAVRGDANGEKLLGPPDGGRYVPMDAVLLGDGRVLILARWLRRDGHYGLVLVRLMPDASLDPGFGNTGTLVLGADMAMVANPSLAISGSGKIAVAYGVDGALSELSTSYFVVRMLRADGSVDTSMPSGGVMSIPIANDRNGSKRSYSARLFYSGGKFVVLCGAGLWQFDPLAGGGIPAPVVIDRHK